MPDAGVVARAGIEGDGTPYSDTAVGLIYARILRVCRAAGLPIADSEDIAQDVWEWLLRRNSPSAALAAPWLAAVVNNHLLRHRRYTGRLRAREGIRLDAVQEPGAPLDTSGFESSEFLDQVAVALPMTERNLLLLVRKGHTLARAADLLGIPRGSRAYHGGRLITLARQRTQKRAPRRSRGVEVR
jgi:DNA-directed RNA polymerase specialized sigma24 family protein